MPGGIILILVLLALAASGIKVVREYERAGRLPARAAGRAARARASSSSSRASSGACGSTCARSPWTSRRRTSSRKDNVSVKVNAVLYFRVIDPNAPWSRSRTTSSPPRRSRRPRCAASAARRSSTSCSPSARRSTRSSRAIIDQHTEPWGIKVVQVAHQAHRPAGGDAARDGAAGRGRARAARQGDRRRGRVPGGRSGSPRRPRSWRRQPIALQLRYLQTLAEIATENNSTTIFPVPIDILRPFLDATKPGTGQRGGREAGGPRLRAARPS